MIHAIFKPRMRWAASITTIATTLVLALTPAQAIAGRQAANNTIGKAIDTLRASLVGMLGRQAGLSDQNVKEITSRPFARESAGSDRYHIAWKIARSMFKNEFNPQGRVMKKIYVTSGDNPTGALAASSLKDRTLLLAPPKSNDNIAAHKQTTCRGGPHFTGEDHEAAQQEMLRLVNNVRTEAGLDPVTVSPTAMKFASDYARNPPEHHNTQEERNQYSPDTWGENLLFGNTGSSDKNPLERNVDVCIKDSRTLTLDKTRDAFTERWNNEGRGNTIMYPKNTSIGFGYRLDYRVVESHSKYALAFVKKSTSVGSKSEKTIPEKKSESNPTGVEFTTTRDRQHDYGVQPAEHQQKIYEVRQRSRRPISMKVLGGDPELVCTKFGIRYDWVGSISGVSSGSIGLHSDLPRQSEESSWVYCNSEFMEDCPPGMSTAKPE